MSQAILASITDLGRSKLAEMLQMGRAFEVTHFSAGEGGHDVGDPNLALTPDPSLSSLPSQTFGPKGIQSKVLATPYCVEYSCTLENLEAVGELSNIGLIATYTWSPIPGDPLIGTQFLYAISNFPLIVKTDAEIRRIKIQVQF